MLLNVMNSLHQEEQLYFEIYYMLRKNLQCFELALRGHRENEESENREIF